MKLLKCLFPSCRQRIIICKLLYFIVSVSILGCVKEDRLNSSEFLVFPLGRSSFISESFVVVSPESNIESQVIVDSDDGYWLEFSRKELEKNPNLTFEFNRIKQDLSLFKEDKSNYSKWLTSSYYIDSDNPVVIDKANSLVQHIETNYKKAKRIHEFVISNTKLNIEFRYSFYNKASTTMNLKEGTCMNFSRLFVALCRAAGIPARTIWGIIYGYNPDRNYNFSHQWAEILDDDGNWRVVDLTFMKSFDINDIQYLDLIYAPEENEVVINRDFREIMIHPLEYYNDYPVALTGRLGFRLMSDKRPNKLVTEYNFNYNEFYNR